MVTGYSIRGDNIREWELRGWESEKSPFDVIDSRPSDKARCVNMYIPIPPDKWHRYQRITLSSETDCEYEIFGYVFYEKSNLTVPAENPAIPVIKADRGEDSSESSHEQFPEVREAERRMMMYE